jgi:3-isopropylmalate/(R)-2-methylmalate dehydratase small subunit
MKPFKQLTAVAVPLDGPNIDTDQIIPARFLWRSRASGYGELLFNDLRFTPDGAANPGFILNEPRYANAGILLAEHNFGCGSSREQAVWALYDYGIRAVIAPSFGDIFYNNCCKQGVLPVVLPEAEVAALRQQIVQTAGAALAVDLEQQTVAGADGAPKAFQIAAFRRRQLLDALDDVAMTLEYAAQIATFEAGYDRDMPWLSRQRSGG